MKVLDTTFMAQKILDNLVWPPALFAFVFLFNANQVISTLLSVPEINHLVCKVGQKRM
jgi:hypothetical protein